MAMIRWQPLKELSDLFENLDLTSTRGLPTDIYEHNGNIIIKMNIPGVEPENVDITLEDNHIRIVAHQEEHKEENDRNYYMKEIRSGVFERVIPIPFRVNAKDVDAEFENGTLIITLPHKQQEAKNQKIKAKIKEHTQSKNRTEATKAEA